MLFSKATELITPGELKELKDVFQRWQSFYNAEIDEPSKPISVGISYCRSNYYRLILTLEAEFAKRKAESC